MRDRTKEIKQKGFSIVRPKEESTDYSYQPAPTNVLDYSKIKVGAKILEDAVIDLGIYKKINPALATKCEVLRAIDTYDLVKMREISDFFYKTSGIYQRILRYMAFMYRYDWFVTPYMNDEDMDREKAIKAFHNCLTILDNFNAKKHLGEIALKVLRYGAYYGYKRESNGIVTLQELPPNYCRSRFSIEGKPVVEFNMRFFDDFFRDAAIRQRMINVFPEEFKKGYRLYQQKKLPPLFAGDTSGWYVLEVGAAVRFTANGEEYPAFISVIPLILDLDEAQDLDRKKTLQRLLKIVIQKMPLDKNGDLIFDVDEARELHNNAVQMLGRAIGVDVLTTFADVEVADLTDTSAASAQTDDLERVERQVYNEAGVSQLQFNTDGNIALEKSILNDEATMYNMILQFEEFLNELISKQNKGKRLIFKVQILSTTIYNYKELAKIYKEQVNLGYSKVLPQVALGQSQSSVLANAYFENEVLDLVNLFIPPMSSATMNADSLKTLTGKGNNSESEGGRPTNESLGKPTSEKTMQNKESAN